MNAQQLEPVWQGIEVPTTRGVLSGRVAPDLDPDRGVLLAVDHGGLRHLLIPADADSEPPKERATKGLVIDVDELRVSDAPPRRYFDVACQDTAMHANFTAVAAEILDALEDANADVVESLATILARWRWFWGVVPEALGEDEVIGLFGELWFLEYWLDPVDTATLRAWTGPAGDRHDFKWPTASVEVKATRARSDGAAKHRISSLDQLDPPEQGQLYLFSLRVTLDPIAANSLNGSVDRIRESLAARPELLHAFNERLGLLGYNPAHRTQYDKRFRVVAEELYRLDEGFPRLSGDSFPAGVPAGVDEIAYTLDLAACAPWRIATAPGEVARQLRATLT
jgi:Putative  PD-(D/E)XK family member, (DUF4420)